MKNKNEQIETIPVTPVVSVPNDCCGCGKPLNANGGCDDCIAAYEAELNMRHDAEPSSRSGLHFTH